MLTELVLRYGYVMVAAGVLIEGDATLVAASFLAHAGYFSLLAVMSIAALTSLTMNQVYFRLGRRHGVDRVAKADGRPLFRTILRHTRKHAILLVLGSRFVFGFRMAIPATVGALGMSARKFFIADVCGSIIWAVSMGMTGYAAGQFSDLISSNIHANDWPFALVLIALTLWWKIYRRRHVQQVTTLLDRTESLV
jgi:membrane protein DedA with SNARE-associated domain